MEEHRPDLCKVSTETKSQKTEGMVLRKPKKYFCDIFEAYKPGTGFSVIVLVDDNPWDLNEDQLPATALTAKTAITLNSKSLKRFRV